jgi:hypothetical protein
MEKDKTQQHSRQENAMEGEGGISMAAPVFQLQASASPPPIQRKVSDDYDTIISLLSRGITDWAVTDGEVTQVLNILNGLNDEDLRDTVNKLKDDGYLESLRGNLTDPNGPRGGSHQVLFFKLLERINEIDSQGAVASYPQEARPVANIGPEFESYLEAMGTLEAAAIADGYSAVQVITAFRKIYYDSRPSREYGGTTVGGGAWGILIPGATTGMPPSWQTTENQALVEGLRQRAQITIAEQQVDVGHLFAGLDAVNHPTEISVAYGLAVHMRSNIEASTWSGDLGSVIGEYIMNAGDNVSMHEFTNTPNMALLNDFFDDNLSTADMNGDIDVYNIQIDTNHTVTQNLRNYYQNQQGRSASQRYTRFAQQVGYLQNGQFNDGFRSHVVNESFDAALAYVAGKGRRDQVMLVRQDQGPPLVGDNHWELYYNVTGWVADMFLEKIRTEVAREAGQ